MKILSKALCVACLFVLAHAKAGQPPPMGPTPITPDVTIQWFATLESARAEAMRTNRPILMISGTPHCSGISGIW